MQQLLTEYENEYAVNVPVVNFSAIIRKFAQIVSIFATSATCIWVA